MPSKAPTLALLAALILPGLAPALEPGAPAPPLSLEVIMDGPPAWEASWKALEGRAVVIEFWATWCAPCVGAIGHWNELVEDLDGEPVIWLSVTDESPEVVRSFLDERALAGWVGLDEDRSLFEAFGVRGIPRTVLIDARGIYRGSTYPYDLSAAMVRRLARGEAPGLPDRPTASGPVLELDAEGAPEPLVRALVRPHAQGPYRVRATDRTFEAAGVSLESVLPAAYGVTSVRLAVETDLPEQSLDMAFAVPLGGSLEAVMAPVLESAFGLSSRRDLRSREVWLLTVAGSGPPPTAAAEGSRSSHSGQGRLTVVGATSAELARHLEQVVERPVLDASELEGRYDVELAWEPGNRRTLEGALEAVGLELVPARREVEMVVIGERSADGSGQEGDR